MRTKLQLVVRSWVYGAAKNIRIYKH